MQPYYGDEPHIIQKRPQNRRGYRSNYGKNRGRGLRVFLVLAVFAIIPVAATYAFLSKTEVVAGKTYRVKAETRYFLVTGTYDSIADANLAAAIVKERGGAGYIFNDGKFRIVAAVYKDKKTAETVAVKQKSETEIYPITIKETTLGSDKAIAKSLAAALNVYDEIFRDLTAVTEEYEKGNSTEGALALAATNAAEGMKNSAREIAETDETGLIGEYLTASADTLIAVTTEESYTLPVRVRCALCSLVYERYALSSKLSTANREK